MYSAGDTKFHEEANFVGNGQYEVSLPGEEPANEDGGALANYGTMEVSHIAMFLARALRAPQSAVCCMLTAAGGLLTACRPWSCGVLGLLL